MNEFLNRHATRLGLLCLVLAACLLLVQHWGLWLSNSDDASILQQSMEEIHKGATEQGRFWLIPIYLLAQLPYKLGSWAFANGVKILVNGAVLAAFVAFWSKLIDVRTGVLAGLVWLGFIDVSPGYYSPFHGYLMMFNLEFIALFSGFAWYVHRLRQTQRDDLIVGPYLMFGFSLLAYEPMLFYAGVFPLLAVSVNAQLLFSAQPWPDKRVVLFHFVWAWLRRNIMLLVVVAAYISVYFLYRKFTGVAGRGIDGQGEFSAIFKTIYRFSVYGFRVDTSLLSSYVAGVTPTWQFAVSVLYGLLVVTGVAILVPRNHWLERMSVRARWLAVLALAFYMFIPNSLHGMVEGYRQWAVEDPHYVGNYFSSFAFAPLLMVGLLFLFGAGLAYREKALFVVVLYIVLCSATNNQMRWMSMAGTNRGDAALWERAIADLEKTLWANTPAVPLVCGRRAPEKVSGDDRYFSRYLSERLGHSVQFQSKNLTTAKCDVTIDFNQYRYP